MSTDLGLSSLGFVTPPLGFVTLPLGFTLATCLVVVVFCWATAGVAYVFFVFFWHSFALPFGDRDGRLPELGGRFSP